MIILPAEQELDWRRPPVITVLLIVINTVIFFAYQTDDDQRFYDAVDFYVESGLLEEEARIYLDYVEATKGYQEKVALQGYAEQYSLTALGEIITTDLAFSAYLRESMPERWTEE